MLARRLVGAVLARRFSTCEVPAAAKTSAAAEGCETKMVEKFPLPPPLTVQELRRLGLQKQRDEEKKRRRSLKEMNLPMFEDTIRSKIASENSDAFLTRRKTKTVQINIGLFCNQACNHCHVESSPQRTESLNQASMDRIVELVKRSPEISTIDITGGAPELNPLFRYFVDGLCLVRDDPESPRKLTIIDRCNLTCLYEPGQEDLADYLADRRVQIVASLPCYQPKNVNRQRGQGVFDKSIRALLDLNKKGFGMEGTGLEMHLVFNPQGPSLPPDQRKLEAKYKEELLEVFGIHFNNLYTMNNMPIKRFADYLVVKSLSSSPLTSSL